ncbi:MAG TPA: hypothetical protein VEX37_05800 [Thermomicrobiales bacterium]|nr:hypothetical protein [Thermomicrobiales bacterium]
MHSEKVTMSRLLSMKPGLIGALVAIVIAIAITAQWGPLFGVYGWRAVAAGLMLAEVLVCAGLLEFMRAPNPYSRVYHLYDLRDLGPTGELQSSDLRWLWNLVPLSAGLFLLFLTDRLA